MVPSRPYTTILHFFRAFVRKTAEGGRIQASGRASAELRAELDEEWAYVAPHRLGEIGTPHLRNVLLADGGYRRREQVTRGVS